MLIDWKVNIVNKLIVISGWIASRADISLETIGNQKAQDTCSFVVEKTFQLNLKIVSRGVKPIILRPRIGYIYRLSNQNPIIHLLYSSLVGLMECDYTCTDEFINTIYQTFSVPWFSVTSRLISTCLQINIIFILC